MDQQEYVKWVRTLERHDPDETYEEAHFPVPKSKGGTEVIKLSWYDHAIQGLFQSEEYGDKLFWPGSARRALYETPGFCAGWFEACELYDKWVRYMKGMTYELRSKLAIKLNSSRPGHTEKMWQMREFPVTCTHLDTNEVCHFVSSVEACRTLDLTASAVSLVLNGNRAHHKKWVIRKAS